MGKKIDFKKIGMRVAGAAAGGASASALNKFLPNMNPKVRSIIKIAAGAILPELIKKPIVEDASIALAGVGVYELANTMLSPGTGVQGIGNDPEYTVNDAEYQVEGTEDEVNGTNDAMSGDQNDAMSGPEDQY